MGLLDVISGMQHGPRATRLFAERVDSVGLFRRSRPAASTVRILVCSTRSGPP